MVHLPRSRAEYDRHHRNWGVVSKPFCGKETDAATHETDIRFARDAILECRAIRAPGREARRSASLFQGIHRAVEPLDQCREWRVYKDKA